MLLLLEILPGSLAVSFHHTHYDCPLFAGRYILHITLVFLTGVFVKPYKLITICHISVTVVLYLLTQNIAILSTHIIYQRSMYELTPLLETCLLVAGHILHVKRLINDHGW